MPMEDDMHKGLKLVIGGLFVTAMAGCTGTTVKPDAVVSQRQKSYSVAIVSEIAITDELWHNYAVEARRELVRELTQSQAFPTVLDDAAATNRDALELRGKILEVDKGSAVARALIGLGAGRAHITAEFRLSDAAGNPLGSFTVRKSYAGGVGIGGVGLLDLDDLAAKLGKEAGDSVASWARSGSFSPRQVKVQ